MDAKDKTRKRKPKKTAIRPRSSRNCALKTTEFYAKARAAAAYKRLIRKTKADMDLDADADARLKNLKLSKRKRSFKSKDSFDLSETAAEKDYADLDCPGSGSEDSDSSSTAVLSDEDREFRRTCRQEKQAWEASPLFDASAPCQVKPKPAKTKSNFRFDLRPLLKK